MAHDYYWNASQCASSRVRSSKKSLRLQTNVERSLNHSFAKGTWLSAICSETTDVHLWWRTDDRRRIRRLAFFSFAISISISVFVRLVWFLSVALSFSLAESSLSSVSHGVLPLSYSVFNCIVNNDRMSIVTRCGVSLNCSLVLKIIKKYYIVPFIDICIISIKPL